LGDVREQAGLFDGALEAFRRAQRLVGNDPVAQGELLLKRAWARERAGHLSMALSETTRAKRAVAHVHSIDAGRLAARATAFSATVRLRQEQPRDALRRAQEAAEQARAVDEKAALARAFSVMAWSYLRLGRPGALALSEQALELYEELADVVGQSHINNNLGMLAYFDGRWDDALSYYERSREGSELLGNVVDVGFVEANIGELLVNQLRLDEAEPLLRHASLVLRASGEILTAAFADLQLGRVLIERGDIDSAHEYLIRVRGEVIDQGFVRLSFESALYLADCHVRRGQPQKAIDLLDGALIEAGDEALNYMPTEARLRGSALTTLGHDDDARQSIDRGLSEAREVNFEYEVAQLLLLKAEMAARRGTDEAEEWRKVATEILVRLGVRSEVIAPDGSSG
jgi:tetratricopeptide (TPR) repeat protein